MGRSVSYPRDCLILTFRTLETGYQAAQDDVDDDRAEKLGDWVEDEFAWDDMVEDLTQSCMAFWPSLYTNDEWVGREDHAYLSNGLVRIGMSEYCGLVSVWVIARDEETRPLAERWARQIEPKFLKFFGQLDKIGNMSNGEGVYQRRAQA